MQTDWTIKELITWTSRYFQKRGIDEARLEAEILLAHVLEKDRVFLYTYYDLPVNQEERSRFKELIRRRINHEPVAYLVGYKEFMSLPFKVTADVLIPRPETELMVEEVVQLCSKRDMGRVCDVGTGCGAIAVSLAYYLPEVTVVATELSLKALSVARENALRHSSTVFFYHSDLLEAVADQDFDIIVANLPYIPEQEYRELAPEIRKYEPVTALLCSGDGLDLYRRLIPQAMKQLRPDGHLFMEIAHNQADAALKMAEDFADKKIINDLAGRPRILKIKKGGSF